MVVGEIGFDRDQFLHLLKWWEIRAIIDGYHKRERTYCVLTRWSTFMIMCTGMADLKKAGIHHAEDLMTFPWEKDEKLKSMFNEDEFEELNRLLKS